MSNLKRIIGRLVATLLSSDRSTPDPESMTLHDWADLPVHHPVHDRAPC